MLLDWRWNCRQQCLYNLLCDSSMFSPIHHVWTSEPDLPAQLLSYAMCLLALDFDQLRWTVLCLDCENMVYFATNKTFDQNDGFQERMRRRRYSNRGEGEEDESTQVVNGSVKILFVCWSNFWWRARLIFVIEDHPGGQWECEGEKKRRGEEIKSKQSGQDIIGRLVVSRHDTWYDICLFFMVLLWYLVWHIWNLFAVIKRSFFKGCTFGASWTEDLMDLIRGYRWNRLDRSLNSKCNRKPKNRSIWINRVITKWCSGASWKLRKPTVMALTSAEFQWIARSAVMWVFLNSLYPSSVDLPKLKHPDGLCRSER